MRFVTPAFLVCVLSWSMSLTPAEARIGESQEEFERRLLRPDVGKFLPRERNPDPLREAEILRQQPFNDVRVHFPAGTREGKYWKSAVPNVLSNDNGWRVHVFFHENCSSLEAYQRVGDALSEFEIRNILTVNQGTSEWRRVEPESPEAKASVIGCDYQLVDGTRRARVVGNWLLVYATTLDEHVRDQMRTLAENRARAHKERLRQQQEAAPGSTSGF